MRRKKDGMCVSGMEGPRVLKNKILPCHNPFQGRGDGEEAQWHGRMGSSNFHTANPQIPQQKGPWLLEPEGSFRGEGGKGMLRTGKIALAPKPWGQAWLGPRSFCSLLRLTRASTFSCQTPRPTPLPLILFGSFFLLWEAFLIGFFFLKPNVVSFLCSPKHQGCCFNVHSH